MKKIISMFLSFAIVLTCVFNINVFAETTTAATTSDLQNWDNAPNIVAKELPVTDVTRWNKNSSGTMDDITIDTQENAVKFHVKFSSDAGNWIYPGFNLKLPDENMSGALGVSYEIKADSVINGFDCSFLMAVGEGGLNQYLSTPYPTTSWQKVYVDFADFDPAGINKLQIGSNPKQIDFTYMVRNLQVYYDSAAPVIKLDKQGLELPIGGSQTVIATVYNMKNEVIDGAIVTWTSENPDVASVDNNGTIIGAGLGDTVIKALYMNAVTRVKVSVGSPFSLITDQPGNAFTDSMALVFKLKYPVNSETWDLQVTDWLGLTILSESSIVENQITLSDLPLGYYRLHVKKDGDAGWQNSVPFAIVIDPSERIIDPNSPYCMDSGQSYTVPPYPSSNSVQPPDTYRVVSDLEKLAGFSMIRDRVSWGEVNQEPGVLNWQRDLANANLLAERGIKILNVFGDAPAWARNGRQSMPDLFALYQFTQEAAKEFKDTTPAWEFWNEQDISWGDTPWDYAAALKAAYLGYKAGNPEVNVLIGSDCLHPVPAFFDVTLKNGTANYFDTYNFHSYVPLEQFNSMMENERDFLERYGMEDKPMWLTESGLTSEGYGTDEPIVAGSGQYEHNDKQERQQAEYLVKEQILSQSMGVRRNFSFIFPPYNEWGGKKVWGILSFDYLVKPAYSALANLTAQLGNSRYLGQYKVTDGVDGYLYENNDDHKQSLVLWSSEDEAHTVTIDNSASQLNTFDIVGKSSALSPIDGDNYIITVTKYPIYVRGLQNLEPTTPAIIPDSPESSSDSMNMTTILSIKLGNNFSRFGKASAILTNGNEGTAALDVYNFSDKDSHGTIENLGSGYELEGLPSSIDVPAMNKVSIPVIIKLIDDNTGIDIKIGGTFDSKPISQIYVPLVNANIDQNANLDQNPNLMAKEIPVADASRWIPYSNGNMTITKNTQENAVHFQTSFQANSDDWVYPKFLLNLPDESMAGAIGVSFEIKADDSSNGFLNSYIKAAREDIADLGSTDLLDFSAMSTSWQTKFVLFDSTAPANFDPASLKMISPGTNFGVITNTYDFGYSVRNLKVYYPKTTQSVPTAINVSPADVTLNAGDSQTTVVTVYDQNNYIISGLNIIWSSDNPSIADVSQGGVITAKTAGATIIRTKYDGLTAQINVTVNQNTTPKENLVPQSNMTATASSYESGNEASMTIDGDRDTIWHTSWSAYVPLPQSITLKLGDTYNVTGINYLPRQDGNNHGWVTKYNIYLSTDGMNYTKVVSDGVWANDATEKTARFTNTTAVYVKLEAVEGGAGFASAAEINVTYNNKFDLNTYYIITNKNSGKCLDVYGESTGDGAQIIQWPYCGGANQQWQIDNVENGYYKIVNKNSGKALDVFGASTEDGAQVIQWPYDGGANQQWQIEDTGNGYYKIVNKNSGKALDVFGASTDDGKQIIQWPYGGGVNQQWQISAYEPVKTNIAPVLGEIGDKKVDEGQQLTFAVNATDADNDPLSYNATGLPAGAIFDASSGTFTWTPGYEQAGTYKVEFDANDGRLSDSEDVNIAVNNVNRAPMISPISGQVVDEGKELKFEVSALDSDGDDVIITPSNLPEGASFDSTTGVFLWEPDFTGAGEYTVHFEASDGSLRTGVDVGITVRNVSAKELTAGLSVYMDGLNLKNKAKNLLVKEMDDVASRLDKKQYKQALVKLKVFMLEIKILSPRIIPKAQADFIQDECIDIIMAIKADAQGQDKSLDDKKINEILDKLKKLKEKNETDGTYEKVINAIDEFIDRIKE